ncbi:MAG: hypothetical protein GEV11_10110 [Streptosporangiales bacterium]|nr:hypothetical protein [Streptosporangiales bacterium]
MASRLVAVLIGSGAGFAPPGVAAEAFRLAMAEDTYEVVAGLDLVAPAVAAYPEDLPQAEEIVWPGTPVIPLPPREPEEASHPKVSPGAAGGVGEAQHGGGPGGAERALFAELADRGAETAVIVAGDAPDLPGLLVGKLFRALGTAQVAVCQAEGGGLVALAGRLPFPTWAHGVGLDNPLALETLRDRAPRRRDLGTGPGWHRVRGPADLARLDPGLEGWDATRALLTGHPLG